MRENDDWLANFFFNWVLPFGLLFLLWGWFVRRMGTAGKAFLNIGGNRVHIHPNTLPKVSFDDVAGADDAKEELKDQLAILLAGRVSEELVFGDVSTGAQNDLERASQIARSMVTELGMNAKLGPLTYGKKRQLAFLGVESQEERNYSELTARMIDEEVRKPTEEAHRRAAVGLASRRGPRLND